MGNPAFGVAIQHPEDMWKRTFRDDSEDLSVSSVQDGGAVSKFKASNEAYSLVEGRLTISSEVDSIEEVDLLFDNAVKLIKEGE
jgi:hypothetical protein